MHSKQKTRGKARKQVNGKRKAISKSAALEFARAGMIAGLSKAGKYGSARSVGLNERKITAPQIGSAIRSRLFGFRFSKAAPCDLFPEGGLRIAGTLPPYTTNAGWATIAGNSTNVSLNIGGAAAPVYALLVSPTGPFTPSTPSTGSIFSASSPLASFAQYFRRFRFRVLELDYASTIGTSSSDNRTLQFSYEPDAFATDSVAYTMATAVCTNTVEFPAWTPQLHWRAIDSKKTTQSDELYYLTTAGDSVTAQAANIRMISQGAIIGTSSSVTGTASVSFGRLLIRFEIDLYGFEAGGDGALPAGTKRSFSSRSPDASDEKRSQCVRRDEPDYVSLTPRRDLRVQLDEKSSAATPAPRVASRK